MIDWKPISVYPAERYEARSFLVARFEDGQVKALVHHHLKAGEEWAWLWCNRIDDQMTHWAEFNGPGEIKARPSEASLKQRVVSRVMNEFPSHTFDAGEVQRAARNLDLGGLMELVSEGT